MNVTLKNLYNLSKRIEKITKETKTYGKIDKNFFKKDFQLCNKQPESLKAVHWNNTS